MTLVGGLCASLVYGVRRRPAPRQLAWAHRHESGCLGCPGDEAPGKRRPATGEPGACGPKEAVLSAIAFPPARRFRDLMVGREITDIYPARDRRPGQVVLHVAGLRRDGILHDLDLEVREGEIVGICGLAGAGGPSSCVRSAAPIASTAAPSSCSGARSRSARRVRQYAWGSVSCPRTARRRVCSSTNQWRSTSP